MAVGAGRWRLPRLTHPLSGPCTYRTSDSRDREKSRPGALVEIERRLVEIEGQLADPETLPRVRRWIRRSSRIA